MIKRYMIFNLILVIVLLVNFNLKAEENQEKKDVILLVDISNSMKLVFDDVQSYLIGDLINQVNIGDNVFIIKFYGQSEVVYSEQIKNKNDIEKIVNTIKTFSATGPYTDIGNALDKLTDELERRDYLNNKKYVLLLTDGRQDAPPGSKYYTDDYSISHELLKNAREINRKGWKIQILSIGNKDVKEIAEEMGAVYRETSEKPTREEFIEKTTDLFQELNFKMGNRLGSLYKNKLKLEGIATSTYDKKILVDISKISIGDIKKISEDKSDKSIKPVIIRDNSYSFVLNENEEKKIKIPTRLIKPLKPGKYSGELSFYFDSDITFTPSSFLVTFYSPGFFERNLLILIFILLLLIAIVTVGITRYGFALRERMISLFSSSKKRTGLIYEFIDGSYKTRSKIYFKKNEIKSIGNGSVINIPRIGFDNNIAEILYDKKGFHLIIKKNAFFLSEINNEEFLDKEIELKSTNNKKYIVKFSFS